jgi:hypothetical protein
MRYSLAGRMDTAAEFTALLICGAWKRLRSERHAIRKSMSRTAKITIVLFCFSLCGASTFVASTVREKREPQKTDAIPVKNHEVVRRVWIQV